MLALSDQDDQAVVTTTLGLLRNLGVVMGVSVSSWVLQNTLVMTLEKRVRGPEKVKREVVEMVRRSVRAVGGLAEPYRGQAIGAYAEALRYTFISGSVFAVFVVLLVVPVRLPKLQKKTT